MQSPGWDSRPAGVTALLLSSNEALRLEKISRITESNLWPITTRPEHLLDPWALQGRWTLDTEQGPWFICASISPTEGHGHFNHVTNQTQQVLPHLCLKQKVQKSHSGLSQVFQFTEGVIFTQPWTKSQQRIGKRNTWTQHSFCTSPQWQTLFLFSSQYGKHLWFASRPVDSWSTTLEVQIHAQKKLQYE